MSLSRLCCPAVDVGTKLYMAPEATARLSTHGPQDQKKADMYSLGVSTSLAYTYLNLKNRVFRSCFLK
jgi:serine/threonine protein kinase